MTAPRLHLSVTILAALALLFAPTPALGQRLRIPSTADQLIVVASPTHNPPGEVAIFRGYERAGPRAPWRLVFGPWPAEIGYAGLRDHRREGDGSTPTGVFAIGGRLYGTRPNPGGLHYPYHRLVCGDWWDSDPYTPRYNQFVHLPCGVRPRFRSESELLWTETLAYPFFAVIRFNVDPTIAGRQAPGSAIFLHSWVYGPTAGCVALPEGQLLAVLRWLNPSHGPEIEIGTARETGPRPATG